MPDIKRQLPTFFKSMASPDMVDRLLTYVASVPPSAHADELKDQLGAYTYGDLRAACSRLSLPVPRRLKKKSGFIAVLTSNWQGGPIPGSHKPREFLKEDPHEAAQLVKSFSPDGQPGELRSQLDNFRSRALRSACVLLELQPKKHFAKPNFIDLLAGYWRSRVAGLPEEEATRVEEVNEAVEQQPEPVQKRTREPAEEVQKAKKPKVVEQSGELDTTTALAASLEKARVVKEWAAAMEILSRVDGSAASIASIRALIDGVVESEL